MVGTEERYESKEFLRFAAEQGGVCCICRKIHGEVVPAKERHHFGEKGMGQKGSDFRVARLCLKCHKKWQGKRGFSFTVNEEFEVYNAMLTDAIELVSAYANYLEGLTAKNVKKVLAALVTEANDNCARAEMQQWLLENAPDRIEDLEWMLQWANRRSGNVIAFLAEPMREISGYVPDTDGGWRGAYTSMRFVAQQALKRCGL